MGTIRRTAVALGVAAALLLAGCGDARDLVERASEGLDQMENQQSGQDGRPESGGDGLPIEIAGRTIDARVHYLGLEYTFGEMTVVELDVQSGAPFRGMALVFDVDVFNPRNDTAMPSPRVTLRWDEPDSDNVVEVNGRGEFRQVPGNASASGEIRVDLTTRDLETFDDASARLILGQSGRSPAQVPVGAAAELIDRFPVPQPGMEGRTLELGNVTMTIQTADIRWNYGNSHLEDGLVLLDLTYTWENNSGSQVCHNRGAGQNFSLVGSGGGGYVDENVSIRCAVAGETALAATGFVMDADYAGEYTFRWNLNIGFDDLSGEVAVLLEDGPGVPDSER